MAQDVPKTAQDDRKMAQDGDKMGRDGLKRVLRGPKRATRGRKRAIRALKINPRGPKMRPRGKIVEVEAKKTKSQNHLKIKGKSTILLGSGPPRTPKMRLRWPQDDLGWAKMAEDGLKMG